YNTGNAKELRDTEEFPKRKSDSDSKEESLCEDIQDYLTKSPDYPAEEIYIPSGDHCYEAGLFYSLQRGNYRYNISPIYTEEYAASNNLKKQTAEIFGEFFTVALNFRLIDISRPKPKPKLKPKPKTPSAPMPVSAKKSNGKLICAKKNDKPRKSKQNKGKHMDMECCLDPDEYPNPHCTY
ncbi:hypothetical protein KJ912_04595, partial [Patescibacteria group bacterium]|nr:hypothetical protein [Patescibacteria group bacterium]